MNIGGPDMIGRRERQELALPHHWQGGGSVDHRIALSNPALVSASSEKSFSSASCPTLTWSTVRPVASDVPPNTATPDHRLETAFAEAESGRINRTIWHASRSRLALPHCSNFWSPLLQLTAPLSLNGQLQCVFEQIRRIIPIKARRCMVRCVRHLPPLLG